MTTDYAAAARSYASHVSFYRRNSALQTATTKPNGMLIHIGGNQGSGMPLLVPMDQWGQFKSIFGAKHK